MPSIPNIGTAVLRVLHRLQRQLTDLRERLDRGPRLTGAAETHVQHCDELLAKAKAEVKDLRIATDKKQLQLKTKEDKVKEWRSKLNAATSNREYQLLREQIAADEMANSVLADEILEDMEKADELHSRVVEAEETLAAAKRKAEEVRADTGRTEPTLRAEIARFEAELRESEATLPSDIREWYARIVRQKGEDALAVIENQCCGGCNQQVPINLYSQVMLGQPAACKTCGRLLYLPE